MNRPLQLVAVRHAESARNAAKKGSTYFADDEARSIVKGTGDHLIPLTEEGHRQAITTGLALRERFGVFDYAYHSGFVRTIQTMDHILAAYTDEEKQRTRVRMNTFLAERNPGFTYDMTAEEAEKHFPYLKEHWQTFGGFFAGPPGGESLHQMSERVYLFLNMLMRDRIGEKVLVVLHGGTLRCLRFLLERWNYEQATSWPAGHSPLNCGVTVYNFDRAEQRLVLAEYNTVYY